jgi:hypothetical protein
VLWIGILSMPMRIRIFLFDADPDPDWHQMLIHMLILPLNVGKEGEKIYFIYNNASFLCFSFLSMPWMPIPIRIRKKDADPTRSGYVTLELRYLSSHSTATCNCNPP